MKPSLSSIRFWNGNKSGPRQKYETDLVQQLLTAIDRRATLTIDDSDRQAPSAEAGIFKEGFDLLITVAGNPKFEGIEQLIIAQPLAFGILGCRIPIYRRDQQARFQTHPSNPFKHASIGLPSDWADVPIFQANEYQVVTQENLKDCFEQVAIGAVDYLCLGANEVSKVFKDYGELFPELKIDTEHVLYYPMPLQFYCDPQAQVLHQKLSEALDRHARTGRLSALFAHHFGAAITHLTLPTRRIHRLTNPMLLDQTNLTDPISPLLFNPDWSL